MLIFSFAYVGWHHIINFVFRVNEYISWIPVHCVHRNAIIWYDKLVNTGRTIFWSYYNTHSSWMERSFECYFIVTNFICILTIAIHGLTRCYQVWLFYMSNIMHTYIFIHVYKCYKDCVWNKNWHSVSVLKYSKIVVHNYANISMIHVNAFTTLPWWVCNDTPFYKIKSTIHVWIKCRGVFFLRGELASYRNV